MTQIERERMERAVHDEAVRAMSLLTGIPEETLRSRRRDAKTFAAKAVLTWLARGHSNNPRTAEIVGAGRMAVINRVNAVNAALTLPMAGGHHDIRELHRLFLPIYGGIRERVLGE